ncbi:hypothetical protein EON65_27050, partial [archaeon]
MYGAESISTALGFYRLGDVFLAEGDMVSTGFYLNIWDPYSCARTPTTCTYRNPHSLTSTRWWTSGTNIFASCKAWAMQKG